MRRVGTDPPQKVITSRFMQIDQSAREGPVTDPDLESDMVIPIGGWEGGLGTGLQFMNGMFQGTHTQVVI